MLLSLSTFVIIAPMDKRQFALVENAKAFIARYRGRVGFFTLTFADHVLCHREASRRFNSLRSNSWPFGSEYICIQERQKSGRIHYHLLVVCPFSWPACDWQAVRRGNYRSVPKRIRKFWRKIRAVAKSYNFGRSEVMPVLGQGLGVYLAKYLAKSTRHPLDKGCRLVRYSHQFERQCYRSFSWFSPATILFGTALNILRDAHPNVPLFNQILYLKRVFKYEDFWNFMCYYSDPRDRYARGEFFRRHLRQLEGIVPSSGVGTEFSEVFRNVG